MIRTLQELADRFPERGSKVYAKMFNGQEFIPTTYNKLHQAVQKVAVFLQQSEKMKKGDKILLSSENRPQWQMSYFGIVYNGLIAVPLDVMYTAEEVEGLIENCGAQIMFVSGSVYKKIKDNANIMSMIKQWVVFDKIENTSDNVVFLEDILVQADTLKLDKTIISPEDVASLIYTSGTTGFAKAVLLTHKNFAHQANNLLDLAKLTPSDVMMSVLPLHHTYMFSVEVASLNVGCSITYVESLKPVRLIAAVKDTGITVMLGIPMLYQKILDGIMSKLAALEGFTKLLVGCFYKISSLWYKITGNYNAGRILFKSLRAKAGFSTVRYLISGAGPLAQKTAEGYAILGFNLANGYGLTEAAPIVSVNPPEGPIDNKSVGVLASNTWWKIDNPNAEGVGEICVKGDNIMLGYYNNPDATKEAISKDGWLHTGDMGYIGTIKGREYLYITGRLKNIIVTGGGKNIYPEELEELINAHPYVMESVVIGVPGEDANSGESPCALVVLNIPYLEELGLDKDLVPIRAQVEAHIREVNKKLKNHQVICGYEIRTEELLKNTTRKVKRFKYLGKDYTHLLKK